jgi:hypothetical protein
MKSQITGFLRVIMILMITTALIYRANAIQVTFQVDMSLQTVSPLGVHVAGNFQNPPWVPSATLMTHQGNNIYAVTYDIALAPGTQVEYKFINGNAWGMEESVLFPCATGGNRFFVLPAEPLTLPLVCFGKCNICNPPQVSVTFKVDMSQQTISPTGIFLAGTFNNWSSTATPMLHIGSNIYAITLQLGSGDYHQYKFKNGAVWETVPLTCTQSQNRFLTVPEVPTTLDAVCYGSCYPCGPPPVPVTVTFQVDMRNETISADGVHITGGFQGWNSGSTLMTLVGNSVYTYTTTLNSGTYQEYKFINGIDWSSSETVPDECGANTNRYLYVPQTDTVLDSVCFSSCTVCPPPAQVDVTFQVDMSNQVVSPDGVHLAGSFQGWNYGSNPMTHVGDGIYQATVNLTEGDHHTYKFVNGNVRAKAEVVPEACTESTMFNGYARYFDVNLYDTLLNVVCFGECVPCVPPPTADITFMVDMTGLFVSPDGVHLAGSFQGWDPAATAMTDQGNGVYAVTLNLLAGESYEYKFINGAGWDGAESVPGECALNGNRYLTVPVENTTLYLVCFGNCTACPPVVQVTFQVDMAEQTVSPSGVHIVGAFQGWNTGTSEMILSHDAVYTYTVTLLSGFYYEYKFINGTTWEEAETVPAGCAQNTNRYITAPVDTTTLSPVCFGNCTICIPPTVEVTFQVDMTNEVVSPEGIHIVGDFQGWDPTATEMVLVGNNIYSYTATLGVGSYHEYKFVNGISFDVAEMVPGECNFNGNRYLTVPEASTTLDVVCFGGCSTCPHYVMVTFLLDMSNETVSPDGVHLVGDFQGWDPTVSPLTDQGNGIFSINQVMAGGSYQTYKFINGNTFDGAEIVPAECGVDDGFGGFKRFIDVPMTNIVLDVVCFSQCGACILVHSIALSAGWNSMSSYVMPSETSIETLLGQIYPELVVMQSMTEVYYPAGGVNTIGTWDSQSAYKIKVTQDVTLTITGPAESNKTLQLAEGWNLIPVISKENVSAETLFGPLGNELVVVKGVASLGVYWPEFAINTLGNLEPGKAYFVKMNALGTITFP